MRSRPVSERGGGAFQPTPRPIGSRGGRRRALSSARTRTRVVAGARREEVGEHDGTAEGPRGRRHRGGSGHRRRHRAATRDHGRACRGQRPRRRPLGRGPGPRPGRRRRPRDRRGGRQRRGQLRFGSRLRVGGPHHRDGTTASVRRHRHPRQQRRDLRRRAHSAPRPRAVRHGRRRAPPRHLQLHTPRRARHDRGGLGPRREPGLAGRAARFGWRRCLRGGEGRHLRLHGTPSRATSNRSA